MKLHTCGDACPPNCPSQPSAKVWADPDARPLTVDMHCHVIVPAIEEMTSGCPEKTAELQEQALGMGGTSVEHNKRVMLPAAGRRLVDLDMRLADMESMGVDIQVISPSPSQYYYWADQELASKLVRLQNESIAALCQQHPGRLCGLGNVAAQHAELAPRQLEYAVRELGLKGVEISTQVAGRELADPSLQPFWAKAEELGCVVFIHPFGTSLGSRIDQYYLANSIGQPLETTIALSSLIFSGTLDRHPGLKLVAAHGGGYLPAYSGRSDHAWRVRPEASAPTLPPSGHLRNIWFDTLVYDPVSLRHLIERVGAGQVVAGTDYPFDMGDYQLHRLVDSVEGLSDEEKAHILGGNACHLLELNIDQALQYRAVKKT
ncbi:amidohydrolase family protein [Pusillimonas noertemannii]|uniref:amidohydrolase family protein n=1 Tax=Pusillimonas noertemannii TaxID=305977 RepID=UPI00036DF70D|nr:amidohydrolase family protein [Pusillimonas noertemannii]